MRRSANFVGNPGGEQQLLGKIEELVQAKDLKGLEAFLDEYKARDPLQSALSNECWRESRQTTLEWYRAVLFPVMEPVAVDFFKDTLAHKIGGDRLFNFVIKSLKHRQILPVLVVAFWLGTIASCICLIPLSFLHDFYPLATFIVPLGLLQFWLLLNTKLLKMLAQTFRPVFITINGLTCYICTILLFQQDARKIYSTSCAFVMLFPMGFFDALPPKTRVLAQPGCIIGVIQLLYVALGFYSGLFKTPDVMVGELSAKRLFYSSLVNLIACLTSFVFTGFHGLSFLRSPVACVSMTNTDAFHIRSAHDKARDILKVKESQLSLGKTLITNLDKKASGTMKSFRIQKSGTQRNKIMPVEAGSELPG